MCVVTVLGGVCPRVQLPQRGACVSAVLTPRVCGGALVPTPGVQLRVADVGGTTGMDIIGPEPVLQKYSHYFHEIIEALKEIGYVEKENLFGIPYDWRMLPQEGFVKTAQDIVETAYRKNNRRVILVSHSLGGLMIQEFLMQMVFVL